MRYITGWDVRTKMITGLIWVVGILLIQKMSILCVLLVLLAVVLAAEKEISMALVVGKLKHILPFLIFMAITLALSGGVPIQRDAVSFSALVCIRVLIAALVIIIVTGAQGADGFISCLASTGLPKTYITILFLMNRYISLLARDLKQQRNALHSRMFTPKSNPVTLKNTGYIVGGLFIRAFDRSEQVYRAMKARCFCGVIFCAHTDKISLSDIAKTAAAMVFISAAVAANYF